MKKKYPSRVLPYYFCDIPHRDNRLVNFMVRGLNCISKHIGWRKPIPGLWGVCVTSIGVKKWKDVVI